MIVETLKCGGNIHSMGVLIGYLPFSPSLISAYNSSYVFAWSWHTVMKRATSEKQEWWGVIKWSVFRTQNWWLIEVCMTNNDRKNAAPILQAEFLPAAMRTSCSPAFCWRPQLSGWLLSLSNYWLTDPKSEWYRDKCIVNTLPLRTILQPSWYKWEWLPKCHLPYKQSVPGS
jgi:hypothetical protein